MTPLPIDVAKSFHYSRARRRVVLALRDHGPMYPLDLSRKAKVDIKTIRWLMIGHARRYHRDRALMTLGLVRAVDDANGRYYELTRFGRRVARRLVEGAGTMVPAPGANDSSR